MALTLFETPDQKVQRERKKFGISVDQEIQRFTRAKGAIAVRQLQDKADAEGAKRQELDFQRQRFRELIAPEMDTVFERTNQITDERTKFRELIMPSVEQEVQRFSRERETTKFRSLVQPSLDALRLGGVGGGFDTAGGVPTGRFGPTGAGEEATAVSNTRLLALQGALDEEAPGFLDSLRFNAANRQAFGSAQAGIPEGTSPTLQINPEQAGRLSARLAQGEFGAPDFPDNISLNKALGDIISPPTRGGVLGLAEAIGKGLIDQPVAGGLLAQGAEKLTGIDLTTGPSVGDVLSEVNQRYLKPGELVAGRLVEGFVEAQTKTGDSSSKFGEFPEDVRVAWNAAFGGPEDQAVLDERLAEIGLAARVAGGILQPDNLIGLGLISKVSKLKFLTGIGRIRRGAGLGDDSARFTVDVLKRGDVSGGGFSQVETVADVSGRVRADVQPRLTDITAPAFQPVGTAADVQPRMFDVTATGATDVVAPRTGDVTALPGLSGADINRAGTSITRVGFRETFRGADVSTSTDLVPARAAGEGLSERSVDELAFGVTSREPGQVPPGMRAAPDPTDRVDPRTLSDKDLNAAWNKANNQAAAADVKVDNLLGHGLDEGDEAYDIAQRRATLKAEKADALDFEISRRAAGGRTVGPGTFPGDPDDLRAGDVTSPVPLPDAPPIAGGFDDAVDWYTRAIKAQRANIDANAAALKAGRVGQGARADAAFKAAIKAGKSRNEAFNAKRAAMRGDLSRADQVVINPPESVKRAIFKQLDEFDFGRGTSGFDFERDRVESTLHALEGGRDTPITESELISLERIMGSDFVDALGFTKNKQGFWDKAFEIVVTPKALLSSLDLSYPLRQGIMAAPGHIPEFLRSFRPMIKAAGSEAGARAVMKRLTDDRYIVRLADGSTVQRAELKERFGLLRSLDAKSSQAEEAFRSTFAEKFPLVRRSNRAFTTFGNQFRSDMFDTVIETWTRRGIDITEPRVEALSNMLNRFTGRGTFKFGAETAQEAGNFTKALQVVMWAPQYRVSGPQALATLKHSDPLIRKEAWRNMAAYMGTGMMILSAAELSGLGEVGVNPLSGEFGKIRVGNIRINIWGTNAVLARTIARALTSQRDWLGFDPANESNLLKIGGIYGRSGLAPEWSAVVDLGTEKDFLGDPVSIRPQGLTIPGLEDPSGLQKIIERNVVPLWMQDVREAFIEEGLWGALGVAPLAFLGTGTTAYGGGPESLVWEIPQYEGLTADQSRDIFDFLGRVEEERLAQREAYGRTDTEKVRIAKLGRIEGHNEFFIDWARELSSGSLERTQEIIDYLVEHVDVLRPRYPFLYTRNDILDALPKIKTTR